MEENKKLAYVRGNDVLFIVSVTTPEIGNDGNPVISNDEVQYIPVDFTGWDDYSLRVVKHGVTKTIVAESSQLVEGEEGKIVVDVPYTALCGTYSLELVGTQNGRHERSYEIMMFDIVESNDKANVTYEIIDGYKSTDLDITVQLVQSALVYGENAYQMWKHLPGNEDKTLQDYIDEVLDLNGVMQRANAAADSAEEAAETASHLPYIGADNYVYEWDADNSEYYKTDTYVKGDPGTPADMSQLYTKSESDARYQQQIPGKSLSTNDYTNEEKSKLAGLHNYDDGPIIWLIQNLQSNLTNYYTKSETYSRTQVNNLIASVHGMEIVLVSVLPTASEETMGKIYLVPSASAAGSNTKDEYITIHEGSAYQWEIIGSTDVSLDGYVTDEELQAALASYYQKPSGGIPSTDLSSSVQTSLGKADTALQSETDPTVPSWAKASSKPSYTASEVGALPDDTPLFSGNYNDLTNKPTIPAAQVQSDWNATTGMGVILNKPTIPTVPTNVSCYSDDTGEGIIPYAATNIDDYEGGDFCISDSEGNVLVKFSGGNIHVKHFTSSPLKEKRISFIGDSITTYADYPGSNNPFYTGSNAGVTSVDQTWWKSLCDNQEATLNRIYAYGGGDIINRLCLQYNNLYSNGTSGTPPDVVFILAGINDWYHNNTLGTIADVENSNTTFYAAYKYLLKNLKETYPNAQIIGLTMLNSMIKGTTIPYLNNNNVSIRDFCKAVVECCDYYSVPSIDLNKIVNINGGNYTELLADYTHPNITGIGMMTKAIMNNIHNVIYY